ncbi:Protein tyrosine kinase [Teratosphaeria destructans]|uniref:non-specific serine/threonine protein kinase n=1 Tax=Teratosphaeria destructans TaxID=418781 RepID=A0A9W7VXU0_9PEZI|nr:Protein tyrosine kinase [Teratosphaeria destructans]
MSGDSVVDGHIAGEEEQVSDVGRHLEDVDSTPKSEVPVRVQDTAAGGDNKAQQQDYFTTRPAPVPTPPPVTRTSSTELSALPALARTCSHTASPTAAAASQITAEGELQLPESTTSLLSPGAEHRPSAQSQISSVSVQSADSNATVTAPNGGPTSAPAATSSRPAFPNQSYAALHSQQYPVRQHAPPVLRQRSSHPAQIHTFSSAFASLHQTGTRTAVPSPTATPGAGLFSPQLPPPNHDDYESPETPGTYASPFLHFTHRVPPKETHVADVDVDPISGRKLINHYEVIDELGRGTHGKVKLARDLKDQGTYVAIKIVERYSKRRKLGKLVSAAEDKVKKEVAILKKARHPNIVALLEVIDDPSRKKVYIVLEFVENGEIKWRTKAPKEIALVEARRYERERSGKQDVDSLLEDEALMREAQRRLDREKRSQMRHHRRSIHRMIREDSDDPRTWSHELGGDDMSEESEEDRLSRISTSTTIDSMPGILHASEGRRGSRIPTPLLPAIEPTQEAVTPTSASPEHYYLPLTSEPGIVSPVEGDPDIGPRMARTGLEGSMYGAYSASSGAPSRVNSLESSLNEAEKVIGPEIAARASEILDSELNPELEYVPIMTIQQARVAFRDTLLGLQYLHYQGIIHRDIKPPNLLSTHDHRYKISDFGVSYLGRPLRDDDPGENVSEHEAQDFDEAKELAKTVGTPAFYAPELCITEPTDEQPPVSKAIDVWALGITLFCMLFARTPFVDSTFVVMRQIADEDIYIPHKRLVPVNEKPGSRPPSHGRVFPPAPQGRRHPLEIVYEDIDDTLHDLLKRLLIKDPNKRISLEEVRHHPWLVADLPNRVKWLEETDPARQSDGRKIEVSNEDVKSAVVPLQFLERVRSGIKKVGERLGLSSKPTRRRAPSSAGLSGSGGSSAPSTHSSSSTLNLDHRRQSLRGDEQIFAALTANRQGEHPLSRSLAPSPEQELHEKHFDDAAHASDPERERHSHHPTPPRPSPPERSRTLMSTAGSVRTLKQSDIDRGRQSSPPSPGLPGTPVALESQGGQGLTAILGSGPARRAFKSIRERSTPRGADYRARSSDRSSVTSSADAHGEPSLAVSNAIASGHVNLPEALQELPTAGSAPGSLQVSPMGSRSHSVVSSPPERLHPTSIGMMPAMMSRQSSVASIKSLGRIMEGFQLSADQHRVSGQDADLSKSPAIPASGLPPESSKEEMQSGYDERIRKLQREEQERSERPTSATGELPCPPSPDDQSRKPSVADVSNPTSQETSPTGHIAQLPSALVSSSSDFGSAVSMSISNPSIPSVISEASSVDPTDGMPIEDLDAKCDQSSGDTLANGGSNMIHDEADEGYSPDHEQPYDSENDLDYDDSSESDGGLVMSRRKSKTSNPEKLAAALEQSTCRRKERRGTGVSARSKKSSRSGSNNTMKKVRTRDSSDDQRRSSFDIEEE